VTRAVDEPTLAFASAGEWERWLEGRHESSRGIWLKFAKKRSGIPSVTHSEALDLALCFGWIDGQLLPLNDAFYRQRFTPRALRSRWSQINVARVAALERDGRMRAAGRAEVERAQADGRWEAAYPGQRSATVPDDLQRALDANPAASRFFAALDATNRYAIIYRVGDARRSQTREQRIARFVAMLAAGEKLHP